MIQPSKELIQEYVNKVGKENVHPIENTRQLYRAIMGARCTTLAEKIIAQQNAGYLWDRSDDKSKATFKLRVLDLIA